ncbi:hypothetical protein M670_00479 [Schinkia azotoformans MEV2011]|uniref:Uncharacterized protein n=1 Tax=Schinkia azotoformans MEV2011 TaxID=1348973 RepID=A0A072NUA1_SCHAZ|nr:hypothetical protein [Schinkia azotoformans]KEF40453.1 hypothetical protein M670_00479 [Schinkia azotoformans MEV2011]MEC1696137.1 hypothetical protein [Schinkia azotoformans]MEC1716648.1 hypothetical protein [Schinkia azotoformans]MEC1725360.1 hypothetical protein [Schinkia azotoformans]MEC1739487.1 hypothetical protein [Schinkia azotoformans]
MTKVKILPSKFTDLSDVHIKSLEDRLNMFYKQLHEETSERIQFWIREEIYGFETALAVLGYMTEKVED